MMPRTDRQHTAKHTPHVDTADQIRETATPTQATEKYIAEQKKVPAKISKTAPSLYTKEALHELNHPVAQVSPPC
jgi:hypothetical protein